LELASYQYNRGLGFKADLNIRITTYGNGVKA
jgi:hypothetical protein